MGCCVSCIGQDPELGDMIEIIEELYSHWAVYVGDGDVVHLTVSESARFLPISKGLIKRSKLVNVAAGHRHRVNNYLDGKYEPKPTATIVQDANAWVGKDLEYNVLLDNCEHFATLMRYGHPESRQVRRGVCACVSCTVLWVVIIRWFKRRHPKDHPEKEVL